MRKKLMINRCNKGEFKMKVFNKYLVIALLLSLIFSVSAVAAQEDMTFEQSDIDNVYDETLTVSSDDTQEIKAVKMIIQLIMLKIMMNCWGQVMMISWLQVKEHFQK